MKHTMQSQKITERAEGSGVQRRHQMNYVFWTLDDTQ